jgi:hypothetical protein
MLLAIRSISDCMDLGRFLQVGCHKVGTISVILACEIHTDSARISSLVD